MNSRETYTPGAASGAEIEKDGDTWTLVLIRDLRHPPAKVWEAITERHDVSGAPPVRSDG